MALQPKIKALRSFAAVFSLSGVIHHCLPTLLLGTLVKLRLLGASRYVPSSNDSQKSVPQSILVLRLDRIGDVVLCSPMLRELRRLYPAAHITIVVNSHGQPLVEHCPYVNEVLHKQTGSNSLRSLVVEIQTTLGFCKNALTSRHWDLAIVPRWGTDTYLATLMCLYSGAARRCAFSNTSSPSKRLLNWGFDSFYTDLLPPGPVKHEAERNLDLIRHLFGKVVSSNLELWLTPADHAYASKCRADFGLSPSNAVIAFGVGSSTKKTRWPASRFAELIDRLRSGFDFTPAIICGPDESDIAREIQGLAKTKVLILPAPSLRQTAAFLAGCKLYIGNDSGPLHIAATARVPVVAISCHPLGGDPNAENSPARFGPFSESCVVVQPHLPISPCSGSCDATIPHCITGISVAEVTREATRLL